MSFDPLLSVLGLSALATPTTALVFAPTGDRAGINIQPAGLLPISNPVAGDLYVDALDSNKLKWYDGSAWQTAGGGGGGAVTSVNGMTGDVTITAADLGAVTSVQGYSGDVTLALSDIITFGGAIGEVVCLDGSGSITSHPDFVWDNTSSILRLGGVYIDPTRVLELDGLNSSLTSNGSPLFLYANVTDSTVFLNAPGNTSQNSRLFVYNESDYSGSDTDSAVYVAGGVSVMKTLFVGGTLIFDSVPLPAMPYLGTMLLDSSDSMLKWYDGTAWQIAGAPNLGVPSAEASDRTLTNADNTKNLICSGTRVFTVNTGLMPGFGCSFKGTVSFTGTATVTDVRTTGATNPWCALCATGTDTYDIVGSKA